MLMADGAVIFITDSIESGDQSARTIGHPWGSNRPWNAGGKSPYGLWGSLGSRNGRETIEEQLNQ